MDGSITKQTIKTAFAYLATKNSVLQGRCFCCVSMIRGLFLNFFLSGQDFFCNFHFRFLVCRKNNIQNNGK